MEAADDNLLQTEPDPNLPQTMCSVPSVSAEELGPQVEATCYKDVPDLRVLFEPPTSIKWKAWRWVFFFTGSGFAVYGVVGMVVPVLPGFPFLAVGLPLMAASNEPARRWANRFERHLPLKTRLMLRKYKPTLPPQGATPEQMQYWRKKTAILALQFLACCVFFTSLGIGATWLLNSYM